MLKQFKNVSTLKFHQGHGQSPADWLHFGKGLLSVCNIGSTQSPEGLALTALPSTSHRSSWSQISFTETLSLCGSGLPFSFKTFFFFFHLKKPTNKKTTLLFPEIPVLLTSCWLIQELFFSFFFPNEAARWFLETVGGLCDFTDLE